MNKFCDILFVYPPTGWVEAEMIIAENDAPPLGLLYIASAARKKELSVTVIDMNHPIISEDELLTEINNLKPKIIAFSVLSTASSIVIELSNIIKKSFPNITLLAGGIHPTVFPENMLSSKIDIVVLGEGEEIIAELAKRIIDNKNYDDIAGLAYLDKNETQKTKILNDANSIIQTSKPLRIENLDNIESPNRELIPILEYGQPGAICSTRGCPFTCSFCSSVLTPGHKPRKRSINKVIDEMDYMNKHFGIDRFQFIDDNFACDNNHAIDISKSLINKNYIWSCQTSVMEFRDNLNLLDLMYESGCREIYFGLESGSNRILKDYKGIESNEAISILDYCLKFNKDLKISSFNNLQIVVGFIIGHPEDDEKSIEETIQLALKLRVKGIDTMLSILQPYPGSLIYNNPKKYGVKIENLNFADYLYPKSNISNKYLSKDRIRELYSSGLYRIMKTY